MVYSPSVTAEMRAEGGGATYVQSRSQITRLRDIYLDAIRINPPSDKGIILLCLGGPPD